MKAKPTARTNRLVWNSVWHLVIRELGHRAPDGEARVAQVGIAMELPADSRVQAEQAPRPPPPPSGKDGGPPAPSDASGARAPRAARSRCSRSARACRSA